MARVPRTSLPDGYFHVFARGVASAGPVFRDDDDCATFTELVWQAAHKHGWVCHAICLMGSHYHLVVQTQRESLSRGLHHSTGCTRRTSTGGTVGSATSSQTDSRLGSSRTSSISMTLALTPFSTQSKPAFARGSRIGHGRIARSASTRPKLCEFASRRPAAPPRGRRSQPRPPDRQAWSCRQGACLRPHRAAGGA